MALAAGQYPGLRCFVGLRGALILARASGVYGVPVVALDSIVATKSAVRSSAHVIFIAASAAWRWVTVASFWCSWKVYVMPRW